jgi:ketosteroid isomerase-like protein
MSDSKFTILQKSMWGLLQNIARLPRIKLTDVEKRLQRLEDELALHDLLSRYTYFYDGNDLDGVMSVFDDDCKLVNPRGSYFGKDAIRENYAHLISTRRFSFHAATNIAIRFLDDGDAVMSAFYNSIGAYPSGSLAMVGGTYVDKLSKKNIDINVNPFNLSTELKDILTDKWDKYNQVQSAIKDNSVNNSRDSFRNNKIKTDKTKLIQRFTKEEQQFNSRLLSTFETMFSANSFHNLKGILHEEGVFFGRMNREKACVYFYNIFFGDNGSSEKFNLEVNRGISMDNRPGEVVLELRCSNFDPFTDNVSIVDKAFGEKPDSSIDETIYRFAFSFKDEKIFTIRVPRKSISENNKLKENN